MYECRIYDGEGNLKRVISPETLKARFWKEAREAAKTGRAIHQKQVSYCEKCAKEFLFVHQKSILCPECKEKKIARLANEKQGATSIPRMNAGRPTPSRRQSFFVPGGTPGLFGAQITLGRSLLGGGSPGPGDNA